MLFMNLVILISVFGVSYLLCNKLDESYGLKEKIYERYHETPWFRAGIGLGYLLIIAIFLLSRLDLGDPDMLLKSAPMAVLACVAYFIDFKKFLK